MEIILLLIIIIIIIMMIIVVIVDALSRSSPRLRMPSCLTCRERPSFLGQAFAVIIITIITITNHITIIGGNVNINIYNSIIITSIRIAAASSCPLLLNFRNLKNTIRKYTTTRSKSITITIIIIIVYVVSNVWINLRRYFHNPTKTRH